MTPGDWFEDHKGFLYLVPLPDAVAEIEGPDNETADAINAACRDHGRLTDADCEQLGLSRVDDFLKRWSPMAGFYHA